MSVHALKGQWLELSTLKLVDTVIIHGSGWLSWLAPGGTIVWIEPEVRRSMDKVTWLYQAQCESACQYKCIFFLVNINIAFSALTLLVGWQEGHLACKKLSDGCWHDYLPGAR